MSLDKLVSNTNTIAIICNQFGDTGKGKFSDYFADHWADVIARGTGGNNAGHTVIINGEEKVFHLLPAGITYDSNGKTTVLGNGMVINLEVLCQELNELKKENMTYDNLMISKDAHVIMSYHIDRDKPDANQEKGGIGTTGRGIGPCYTDKISRKGITIEDLYDKPRLLRKIEATSKLYPEQEIDPNFIIEKIQPFSEEIEPYVKDTITEMRKFSNNGKKILLEGAQGLLLSIEYGTYPYVTSSDCSLNGTASGVGLSAKDIDLPLGIIKFPFMSRVGGGPFPTEIGGKESEVYCAEELEHDIFNEVKEYLGMSLDLEEIKKLQSRRELGKLKRHKKDLYKYIKSNREKVLGLCNSNDSVTQGIGIRLAALEYGATTSRPRRIGWTDAVAAKYAVKINGPNIILTKLDCLEGINNFKICHGYNIPDNGSTSTGDFKKDEKFLRSISPKYKEYNGYGKISDVKDYEDFPFHLKSAISDFEEFTKGRVSIISIGPEKEQTIFK